MFIRIAAMAVFMMIAGCANAQDKPASSAPKTDQEKVSYSIGFNAGATFRRQGIALDPKTLASGITDGITGAQPALNPDELQKILSAFQQQMAAKAQQIGQEVADKNKKAGEAFLAENKKKKGVVTLPSGLQYIVVQEGTGEKPKSTNSVVANYRGTLINGAEFDSSAKHGGPATFPVTGVIKGWTEALQLMKVGSKWQIFVPAELAYGAQGVPQVIGPNSVLVFDIELVAIKK